MSFCIPKEQIDALKKNIASLGGKNQVQKLVKMQDTDRVAFFEKIVPQKQAIELNRQFNRALINKKGTKLKNWMRKNLDEKYREKLDRKFKSIDEFNEYVEEHLDAWAEQKGGVALTRDEIVKFTELGQKHYNAARDLGDNVGDLHNNYKENLEYAKTLADLQEYAQSLQPRSPWKMFTQTVGKASMLASIKTPFLNIESNTINGVVEALTRRLSNQKLTSSVDKAVLRKYRKNVYKIFKETGIDFTRMISVDDSVTGVGKVVGEVAAAPKNKAIKGYSDFVFQQLLTKPDVKFSSYASADSMGINSSVLAKGNKDKATEIFKDAMRLSPKTKEGIIVREQAISDATRATYTNDSYSSKFSESMRELLNKVGNLGDVVMPFVKTPANVAELSADYAGLGLIKAASKTGKMLYMRQLDKDIVREAMADAARSGLGLTTAFLIADQIDPDHFMGAYDPERVKIDQLSNSAHNAILVKTPVGDRWVNLDYFGPLASPLVGMLYAKKYDKGVPGHIYASTLQFFSQLPINEGIDFLGSLHEIDQYSSDKKLGYIAKKTGKNILDAVYARLVPGISYDIARATDAVQREKNQEKYMLSTPYFDINMDQFIQKIPYLRKNLPVKHDAFGRVMYETTPIETMLFGARVKNARMDALTDEIYRLRKGGHTPNIKDLRYMYSSKVDELKEKTGDNFYDVAREYGENLARELEKETTRDSYKNLSDDEKKSRIDAIGQKLYEKTLRKHGVKYK